jgi:hypothetical protein
MRFLMLFLLLIAAEAMGQAVEKAVEKPVEQGVNPAPVGAPLRALIITCDPQFLPKTGEAFGFSPHFAEVSGIAMGNIGEAENLVKPEGYFGGGFVEYHKDLPCFILKEPKYLATIWNPDKTKVWCGVYGGVYGGQRDCVAGPELEKK